jgi:tetratricopeptide (TPR) repeat protein
MPEDFESRFNEGLSFFNDQFYDRAIFKFKEALDQNPACPDAHHYIGRSFLEKKLPDAAIGEFCEAIRKNPRDGNTRYWLALVLIKKKQFADAIPLLREAIQLEPGRFYQFSNPILEGFESNCQFSETEEFFKKCLEIFNGLEKSGSAGREFSLSCAHLHGILGQIYFKKGLLNGAMLQYREAIRICPQESSFHGKLADIYFMTNLNDEAVAEYQVSLAHAPDDAAVHKKLGDAFVKIRQFIDAFNEYREAVRIEPHNEYYVKVYTQFRTLFIDKNDVSTTASAASPKHPAVSGNAPHVPYDELYKILHGGESESVEYKSSVLWSKFFSKSDISSSDSREVHKYGRDASRLIIAKTIACFLNTNGGNLIIGLKENKEGQPDEIIGIEGEYPKLKDPCPDGYRRMIVDEVIRKFLPPEIFHHLTSYIKIHFPKMQEKTLCWLEIKKADDGVFVKVQDEELFFIRIDAETRQISDKALVDYCKKHFR